MSIVLGYAGLNTELRAQHVFMSRTCRSATLENAPNGIQLAIDMMQRNLEDLLKILEWNRAHNIILFRMGSDFAPHITNPTFIKKADMNNYRKLAYDPIVCRDILVRIGDYAREHGMRLTFHPDPFLVLGTPRPDVLIKSKRELYFHTRVLDIMGMDLNSVIVLHGGGVYGDKRAAMSRWIREFDKLPTKIRRRIVIENDEYLYNPDDMLTISQSVKPFPGASPGRYRIPIVFDIFHYECYASVYEREPERTSGIMSPQSSMKTLMPKISKSWGDRIMKMHISNQKPNAPLGSHSDYVEEIPPQIVALPRALGRPRIDIMVEAKMKEQAVLRLRSRATKNRKK